MNDILEIRTALEKRRLLEFIQKEGGTRAIADVTLDVTFRGRHEVKVRMRNNKLYEFACDVAMYLLTEPSGHQLCGTLLHELIGYKASEVVDKLQLPMPGPLCARSLIFLTPPQLYPVV